MIILSASDIEKHFGTVPVLEHVSFHINKGDRVGIVGDNGAGKTTLLDLLTGEEEPDGGSIFVAKGVRMGYLKQSDQFDSEATVLESMEAVYEETAAHAEAWGISVYESEVKGILTSMAFPSSFYDKSISTLSGGERTRLALAALLLRKPDLLFLDEPTNHLDIGTLKWLEGYLRGYQGTLVIVSHDRYFLNQTVNRIFEIERLRLTVYEGNYDAFAAKKKAAREDALRRYEKQQKEIQAEEEKIRWFMGHGTEHLVKRAQSREKRLAHVERLEKPAGETDKLKLTFHQDVQSGEDVLFVENLSKGFRDHPLFRNLSFSLKRGERVAVIGPNGTGKSTLLKLIVGDMLPDSGSIRKGHNVEIGYYDQEQMLVSGTNTVLEELHADWRLYSETELRNILGRFLFRGDDVFKPISALSGGEKARLALLKIMMQGSNLLILDEPTNHLDISSKEIFEEALTEFPGTVLVVSHDRYFLNKVPTRTLELGPDGVTNYLGPYDYYLEKKEEAAGTGRNYLHGLANRHGGAPFPASALSKAERQAERQAQKDRDMQRRRLEKQRLSAEELADRLENEIAQLDTLMAERSAAGDYQRASELLAEQAQKKEELQKAYGAWEEAAEALDAFR